jgi:uncharacterized protein (TIGR04376 family)
MSLFDDLSRFLETRLDEFLRAKLLGDLNRRTKQLEEGILETAKDIQQWHNRIEKAKAANRLDLVGPAQEREAALLRQGNHLWGQLKGIKERIEQTKALHQRVQTKRKEVQTKIAQAAATAKATQAASDWGTTGWNQSPYSFNQTIDPLDESFRQWEAEEELNELRRKMGS